MIHKYFKNELQINKGKNIKRKGKIISEFFKMELFFCVIGNMKERNLYFGCSLKNDLFLFIAYPWNRSENIHTLNSTERVFDGTEIFYN